MGWGFFSMSSYVVKKKDAPAGFPRANAEMYNALADRHRFFALQRSDNRYHGQSPLLDAYYPEDEGCCITWVWDFYKHYCWLIAKNFGRGVPARNDCADRVLWLRRGTLDSGQIRFANFPE
jgi:hypothetical protein